MRLLPVLLLLAACGGPSGTGNDTDTPDTDVAVVEPTFTNVSSKILKPSCSFSVCHGGATGGVQLDGTHDDYARLVSIASTGKPSATLVVPGDAEGSYLVQKLEGASGIVGSQMPSGGTIEPDKLALIKAWIDAGALDN